MRFAVVTAKLGKMRKEQEFCVRPGSDGSIFIQSDKSTGRFDFRTRKGVLNTKGTSFVHLTPAGGAIPFEFPQEFVTACLDACPGLDSETTIGRVTLRNTVQVF